LMGRFMIQPAPKCAADVMTAGWHQLPALLIYPTVNR